VDRHGQHTAAVTQEELLRFVERFAIVLAESGLQRMTARVFAYALADDADRYSASELAEALRVSPAAVSGAVRELVVMGMLIKEREPGDRSDSYRLAGDVWLSLVTQGGGQLESLQRVSADGARLLGADSPGGRRVAETEEFCVFLKKELQQLTERWREHRLAVFGGPPLGTAESTEAESANG
jgi:DNA-binding transcriptional regulator GbsR (MarR family)